MVSDIEGYRIERLDASRSGFIEWNRIYFHLTRDCDPYSDMFRGTQAINKIASTRDGKWTGLSVFTSSIIPEEFLDIIVAHEAVEGNERIYLARKPNEAHLLAYRFHMEYARALKDEEIYRRFLRWNQEQLF